MTILKSAALGTGVPSGFSYDKLRMNTTRRLRRPGFGGWRRAGWPWQLTAADAAGMEAWCALTVAAVYEPAYPPVRPKVAGARRGAQLERDR